MTTKAEQVAAINVQPFVAGGAKIFEVSSDGMLRINMGIKLPAAEAINAAQWLIDNFQTPQE